MKVLAFTTVFPTASRPTHGLFVEERLRHAAAFADIVVVAPVSWRHHQPTQAKQPDRRPVLSVVCPTFFYIPGLFKSLDWVFLLLSAFGYVRRLRRRFDFDLIDGHFGYPDGVAAVVLGWWFRRPVVVTLRGSELVMASFRLRRAMLRLMLPRAQRVIAVSQELARLAERLGVAPDRIAVIGNGVDLSLFQRHDRAEARRKFAVPPDDRLVISVGHLAPVKGFHAVIAAVAALAAHEPRIRLAIVGGPSPDHPNYPATLDRLIRELAVRDRVVMVGAQDKTAIAQWLCAADLFVLASDREGSPNALLEALACGRPVVATQVGGVPDLVPEFAGILVDPDDDEGLRKGIATALSSVWDAERIRSHVCGRSWDRVAATVFAEWRRATAMRPSPT